jgi:hypothetical protein
MSKANEDVITYLWCKVCQNNTEHHENGACAECGAFFESSVYNTDVGVKHSPHCACRDCWGEKNAEPLVYGAYANFRELIDAFCNQFKPDEAYIYPKFAVFEFKWTADSNRFCDYIEDRTATRYTGIHYDQSGYKIVLIDVATKEEDDG